MTSNHSDRIKSLMLITDVALREMRKAKVSDRDLFSQALANIWIRDFGDVERSFLLATAAKAAPDAVFEQMIFDNGGPPPMEAADGA